MSCKDYYKNQYAQHCYRKKYIAVNLQGGPVVVKGSLNFLEPCFYALPSQCKKKRDGVYQVLVTGCTCSLKAEWEQHHILLVDQAGRARN